MMDVKKYRATTTVEALEMVKLDLGEDAYVLGTKRVSSGGFLGLRKKSQVEISAAAPQMEKPIRKSPHKSGFTSNRILNLVDDAPAVPRSAGQSNDRKKATLITALSSRSTAADDHNVPSRPDFLGTDPHQIESVEVSPELPRIVHPKKEVSTQPVTEIAAVMPSQIENSPVTTFNREIDLLRAEMREVKFSLGAFTNRQTANEWLNEIDLDAFGQTFDAPLHNVYRELTGMGISGELARKFVADIVPQYQGRPTNSEELIRSTLLQGISNSIRFAPNPLAGDGPQVLAMIGSTGVGKTTTIAKLAARLALHERRRVELVTLDTYRIAAVEQLKTYAEIIGAGCQVVRSVFELDAVLRRLPSDVTVLIDTTGRNPHDLADQFEVSDYLREHHEIRKCLAVQATTHPLDIMAAIRKFEMYGADCLALTKIDETMRPGAIIEIAGESDLPLAYVCSGQRVPEDLHVATPETLFSQIVGKSGKSNPLSNAILH